MTRDTEEHERIMRNIAVLGERYCQKYLEPLDRTKLEDDWWEALKFFFWHSFMRGRRDELSSEYCSFTIEVLAAKLDIGDSSRDESYGRLEALREYLDWEEIIRFKQNHRLDLRRNSMAMNYLPVR